MSRTRSNQPYRWLATYYDKFFPGVPGSHGPGREEVLRRIMPGVESACDLACGTGTTALALARQGIHTYAVDLSPAMCRLARAKARAAGVTLHVLCASMRTFRPPELGDLIVCEYDAVNHVPRKSDLKLVAESAARALRPGGHFYFDVNNRAGFASYWTGVWWLEKPGVVFVMRNGNDAAHDRAWCDVEWFIREAKLWRRRRNPRRAAGGGSRPGARRGRRAIPQEHPHDPAGLPHVVPGP